MAFTTSSTHSISPSPEDQDISPTAYATLFTLSSVVLILVITMACYNVFKSRPAFDEELGLSARKRGLDEQILGSYPRMQFSQVKVGYGNSSCVDSSGCSICLADYEEVDMVLLLPNCSHFFHVNCLDQWFRVRPTCPICRNSPVLVPNSVPADGSSYQRQELGDTNSGV